MQLILLLKRTKVNPNRRINAGIMGRLLINICI